MYFLQWKLLDSIKNFAGVFLFLGVPNGHVSIGWTNDWTNGKLLPKSMTTQIIDACMHHQYLVT